MSKVWIAQGLDKDGNPYCRLSGYDGGKLRS